MNLQGLQDEFESALLNVAALRAVLHLSTPFERPKIKAALDEQLESLNAIALELLNASEQAYVHLH